MADYRHAMLLLLQGHSYRQVAAKMRCSQNTVARARRVLNELDLSTTTQVEALTREDLDRLFSDGRKSVTGEFVSINFEKVVAARLGRKKPPLKVLWAKYLQTDIPAGSGITVTTGFVNSLLSMFA